MQNARKKAKEIVDSILDEFKGSIKEGTKSISNLFWYFIPFIFGYLFFKGCRM